MAYMELHPGSGSMSSFRRHLAVSSTVIVSSWVLGSSFSNSHRKGEFDKVDTEYSFMVRNPSSKKPGIPFIIASHTGISVAGLFLRKEANSMSCTFQKESVPLQCSDLSPGHTAVETYSQLIHDRRGEVRRDSQGAEC